MYRPGLMQSGAFSGVVSRTPAIGVVPLPY
jgi:hypothetical protein